MMLLLILLLLILFIQVPGIHHHGIHENGHDGIWNNPILPPGQNTLLYCYYYYYYYKGFLDLVSKVPTGTNGTKVSDHPLKEKLITRNLWLGFKHIPSSESDLNAHIVDFIDKARNQSWNVHMLGHQEQLNFLETYYPNSSLVWAYQTIHSQVGVSACDLWRYAALYAFGGLYMDDDSDIQTYLEDAVSPEDTLILAQEGNTYHDNCYIPSYHLSGNYLQQHFPGVDSRLLYGNKILANWAIFAAPRHPALLKIMKNAVELLRKEYLREPAIWMLETEPRWKVVMCSTGPSMLTATIRLMTAEHNISVRVLNKDFKDWGGVYKVEDRDGGSYYMNTMNANNLPILREYVPFTVERLEGRVIQSAKAMFVVNNGNLLYHLYYTY